MSKGEERVLWRSLEELMSMASIVFFTGDQNFKTLSYVSVDYCTYYHIMCINRPLLGPPYVRPRRTASSSSVLSAKWFTATVKERPARFVEWINLEREVCGVKCDAFKAAAKSLPSCGHST
jgi:hypothetical protein